MTDIQIVPESDFEQKRIGILCLPGLETFIKPIAVHFEENYAVRTCYSSSMAELESVINWSDLIILEWCNELAIKLTNEIKALEDKKVIVRCHSYEALSNYIPQIRWKCVDHLVFVASHIQKIVLQAFPQLRNMVPMSVISNGV